MTIELVLAIVGLVGAALTAGRVVFSTEAKVAALERASDAVAAKLAAAHALAFTTEASVSGLTKQMDYLSGKAAAMDALANEGKTAHFRLDERVEALAEIVATKATAESVVNIKESVDSLRRDIKEGFAELARRLDHQPKTPTRKS